MAAVREEVRQQILGEDGRQFAESQDLSTLQRWLTENPAPSPYRREAEAVFHRRQAEHGRQLGESLDLCSLERWLTENPAPSPYRREAEAVYNRRSREASQRSAQPSQSSSSQPLSQAQRLQSQQPSYSQSLSFVSIFLDAEGLLPTHNDIAGDGGAQERRPPLLFSTSSLLSFSFASSSIPSQRSAERDGDEQVRPRRRSPGPST